MASPTIETPKADPPPPAEEAPRAARKPQKPLDEGELHLLIADLRDEATRSRMREAAWISIIIHLLVFFAIWQSPKWLPKRPVLLLTPEEVAREHKSQDLVFSEQPPDRQQGKIKPDTNRISDKDRIATTRRPRIDRSTLDRLANNRMPGAPGQDPQQPFTPPQQQAAPQPLSPQQFGQSAPPAVAQANQAARIEPPQSRQSKEIFRAQRNTPGNVVDQAVREAARSRGGGISGELGGGPGAAANARMGDIEILSDTLGVNFAPYMERVLQAIRTNWYEIIPESARPPILKQGNVYIQFVIDKNGKVTGMRLDGPSGDTALDRAAWGGITGSDPFPPLPREFTGPYLALRIKFMYNPSRSEIR